MKNEQCVRFLQWALPRLGLRWPGYRKVHGQVCKRIGRRIAALGLDGIEQYHDYLELHADEWGHLDELCRITISRFHRDRGVFEQLLREVLPSLARGAIDRGDRVIRVWSAGCGSGEEPYTLAILWLQMLQPDFPGVAMQITATDADPNLLQRARDARYGFGSLRDLPAELRDRAFSRKGSAYCLKADFIRPVEFLQQDIRCEQPDGPFDLVLCRNLAFTYFESALQADVLQRLAGVMRTGSALVVGIHETLPGGAAGFATWHDKERVYRKLGPDPERSAGS